MKILLKETHKHIFEDVLKKEGFKREWNTFTKDYNNNKIVFIFKRLDNIVIDEKNLYKKSKTECNLVQNYQQELIINENIFTIEYINLLLKKLKEIEERNNV